MAVDGYYKPAGGRAGKAAAMKALAWHVALGRGDPDWDSVDRGDPAWQSALLPDPMGAYALVDEIGRRVADEVSFVVPDAAGEIVLSDSRWTRAAGGAASPYLYIFARLNYGDAAGEALREMGLFAGGAATAETPPGQLWLGPGNVAVPGHLMQLTRYAFPATIAANNYPEFKLVVSF